MGRTKTLKEFAVKTKGKHSNRNRQSDNDNATMIYLLNLFIGSCCINLVQIPRTSQCYKIMLIILVSKFSLFEFTFILITSF